MIEDALVIWESPVPDDLHEPVLVVGMDGWIDAGYGGATAVGNLKGQIRTQRLVRFNTDELIDQRARRPVMKLVDGVNTGLRWPRLQLRHGRDRAGSDLLVLTGPEPDYRWRPFAEAVVKLSTQLGVRLMVGLGAFPAPYPHTRPITLGATATNQELADRIGHLAGTFEIPAGCQAALERGFAEADIPAVGIWARVPHYVAAMPYPAAAAGLLDALARISGLVVSSEELHVADIQARRQIDELVAKNPDHVDMVRKLEAQESAGSDQWRPGLSDLPSGEELAAELERFLREQPNGGG